VSEANALERFVRTPAKTVCKDINQNLYWNAVLSKTDDDILNCNRLKNRCTNNLPTQYNETFSTAKWKSRFKLLPSTAQCRCGSCNHPGLLKQKTVRTLSAIPNRAVRKNHMHRIKPNITQVQVPLSVSTKKRSAQHIAFNHRWYMQLQTRCEKRDQNSLQEKMQSYH